MEPDQENARDANGLLDEEQQEKLKDDLGDTAGQALDELNLPEIPGMGDQSMDCYKKVITTVCAR